MISAAAPAIEAIWRIESARLVAGLARFTGDVGLAEELAQDALVVALEQWPRTGIPVNPGGWLTTTAKRRAIDQFRRDAVGRRVATTWARQHDDDAAAEDSWVDRLDDHIGDDRLRLIFTACHPALALESRIALTLRCLAGLRTDEIARAFLITDAQAGQRISRAKKTLRDKGIAFELPSPDEWAQRLGAVLEVIYSVFNEGYSATAGDDWMRPALTGEALRLARLVAELQPDRAEAHGLVALMELTEARTPARTASDGSPVLLADQDRGRWDRLLIRRGLAALERAVATGEPVGAYTVQAAIAARHATAPSANATDWRGIVELYDTLALLWPSPVVLLNRAVAVGMADGPQAGLDALAGVDVTALTGYPQLPAVQGEFLARAGRRDEAAAAFDRAASLTRNEREREVFAGRAATLRR